jgi:hypothetical protein
MKIAVAVAVALPALAAAGGADPFASSAQNAYNGYDTGYQGNSQYCQVRASFCRVVNVMGCMDALLRQCKRTIRSTLD